MKRSLAVAAVPLMVIVAGFGGRAAAQEYDPYRVPKARISESVRTIALAPVRVLLELDDAEARAARLGELIAEQLEAKGYEVVPPREYEAVWVRMSQQVGGVYDPLTGESDPAKFDLVRDHTARELARRYGTDAVLSSTLMMNDMRAYVRNGHWACYDEPLLWEGKQVSPMQISVPQRVLGPHLGVILRDLAGVELYNIRIGVRWWRVYMAGGYEERPLAEVCSDSVRNGQVVFQLLDDLVAVPSPGDAGASQ